ncbi:MAG TPA: hypothetical protein VEL09_16050 [Burkholderiales bacterium]|nr:hypothetical protein [Burkholderiales bacterium]
MKKLQIALVLAASGTLAWWWAGIPETGGSAHVRQAEGALVASKPVPQVDLQLPQRSLSAPSRDPFGVPAKPPPARTAVADAAPTPTPPPLPYQYDGSGAWQGKSFVILKRNDRSFMVRLGDTIEGTYSVEAVARDHAVLRYLPLGIRQVMMYQPRAEAPPELAAGRDTRQPVALQVDMPAEVIVGHEFVVTLALPGAGALKATIEVGYDTEVLQMLGTSVRRGAGRAAIDISGTAPRAQLRFKVLAEAPASTDIELQVSATDAAGKWVPVSAPPAQTVSLVLPGGGG